MPNCPSGFSGAAARLKPIRCRAGPALLRALVDGDPELPGPSAFVNMFAPVEPTLRRHLGLLATVLAMLGEVLLLVSKPCNERFMSFALVAPSDPLHL